MVDAWLSGWKEIAAYLGKSIRTAKHWKRRYYMPVRYDPGGRAVCIKIELNAWIIKFNEKKAENVSNLP